MASKNQVTLTFAGDADKLTKAFDGVEQSADKLTTTFDRSSKSAEEHTNKLGALGEKADNSERSLIGVHDVIDGTATIMQGPGKQGLVAYIQGWADLAGGLAPLLLQLAETKISIIANTVASGAATIAQWAWNAALVVGAAAMAVLTSPITLIVLGIAALVAAIILVIKYHKQLGDAAVAVWNGIKAAATAVASAVSGAFKAAFNFVADVWNNTIGRLSWSVPSWVPFIGGNTIAVPKLPHFHSGTISVPGTPGSDVLAVLQAGETVGARGSASGGSSTAKVVVAGAVDTVMATAIQKLIDLRLIRIEVS